MTAVLLTPITGQFFDNNGDPLNGGLIYSYIAGTTTPQATYTDASGTTPAANPIVLDSAGRADVWGSGVYKFVVKDSLGNTLATTDSVTATFGAGDMMKAIYDPANISQQLVGTTATQTLTNKVINTTPSTTANAGLNVPPGTAPTSPNNGDIWTTTTGAFIRVNGATNSMSSPFTSKVQLGPVTLTAASLSTTPHGLGAVPFMIQTLLRCTTADNGYSPGDELYIDDLFNGSSGGDAFLGIYCDTTNVYIRFSSVLTFVTPNKSSGVANIITNANWRIYLNCVA